MYNLKGIRGRRACVCVCVCGKLLRNPFTWQARIIINLKKRERVCEKERALLLGFSWVPAACLFPSLHYRSAQTKPVRHMRLQLFLYKKLYKAVRSICEKDVDATAFLFSSPPTPSPQIWLWRLRLLLRWGRRQWSQSFKTFMDSEMSHLFSGAVTSSGYYYSESDGDAIRQR